MKHRGFTLIEVLVSIAVILILTAIIVPIFKGSEKRLALQRAANKLAQDIRRAQEMAMSAREIVNPTNGARFVPRGGYGVYFGPNNGAGDSSIKYVIFADCNNNKRFINTTTPHCPTQAGGTFPEQIETVDLEKDVRIDSFTFKPPSLNIIFTPPDPATHIGNVNANTTSTLATIILRNGNATASVKVLNTGLIYVE